jgi:hypothetical protein
MSQLFPHKSRIAALRHLFYGLVNTITIPWWEIHRAVAAGKSKTAANLLVHQTERLCAKTVEAVWECDDCGAETLGHLRPIRCDCGGWAWNRL